jgi:5-oxoprolinase (ATP-hydrolysing)
MYIMYSMMMFQFAIDRGGTFTDIYCEVLYRNSSSDSDTHRTARHVVLKLLSEDPSNYEDAPTEGIRRVLERETGEPHPRGVPVDTSRIESIRMGTTVATNALLERKGERIALVTTAGFGQLQRIGNQSRPKIFDLEIRRPDLLYEEVIEINERVVLVKENNTRSKYDKSALLVGASHEQLVVEKHLDRDEVTSKLRSVLDLGIKSLSVVFLHSYTFPDHELQVKALALEMGFEQVSISSEVMPMIRAVPRGGTTCVDAYLTPVIKKYLHSFARGFDSGLSTKVKVSFMQSDGGLTPMNSFLGNKAILSGPAGGVVGYAVTSSMDHESSSSSSSSSSTATSDDGASSLSVIGFDMGGTSTDVSRYAGRYEHVFESTTGGVTVQSPQLDINTVAAGGGSRLFYRGGLFVVGPESAGGKLTVLYCTVRSSSRPAL